MSIFAPYTLSWDGRGFVIPADRIMRAIAVVEQHLTLYELTTVIAARQTVKMVTLAQAYGDLLRFAGAKVTDEEVYQSFFDAGIGAETIIAAVRGLQMLMVPPAQYKADAPGKVPDGSKAAKSSSRQRSRRPVARKRSAAGG